MGLVNKAKALEGKEIAICLRRGALSGKLLEIDEDVIILQVEGSAFESSEVKKWDVLVPLSNVQYIQPADMPLLLS